MSGSVCLSAHMHISRTEHSNFAKFFMHVASGRGSVLLWPGCDMSRTSGFVDDVMFSHNGPMARHVHSVVIEYDKHNGSGDSNLQILLNDNENLYSSKRQQTNTAKDTQTHVTEHPNTIHSKD